MVESVGELYERLGVDRYGLKRKCILQQEFDCQHLAIGDPGCSYQCRSVSTSNKADLPRCNMELWYDPEDITNVLSFGIVQVMFLVKYDNRVKDTIYMETPRGVIKLKQYSKNLYNEPVKQMNMLSTVAEIKTLFTNRLERAKQAKNLACVLVCPSDKDMKVWRLCCGWIQ
jgi:hypothetical protein